MIIIIQHENLKLAQQYFQLVGSSGSECGKYQLMLYVNVSGV